MGIGLKNWIGWYSSGIDLFAWTINKISIQQIVILQQNKFFLEVTIKKQKFEQFWVLTLSSYNKCFVFENYLNNLTLCLFCSFFKAWPIQVHFLRKQKYNLLFIQWYNCYQFRLRILCNLFTQMLFYTKGHFYMKGTYPPPTYVCMVGYGMVSVLLKSIFVNLLKKKG